MEKQVMKNKKNIICFLNLVPTENVCNGWTDPQEGCPEPVWYADKYCADTNNIGACNYDGGKFGLYFS